MGPSQVLPQAQPRTVQETHAKHGKKVASLHGRVFVELNFCPERKTGSCFSRDRRSPLVAAYSSIGGVRFERGVWSTGVGVLGIARRVAQHTCAVALASRRPHRRHRQPSEFLRHDDLALLEVASRFAVQRQALHSAGLVPRSRPPSCTASRDRWRATLRPALRGEASTTRSREASQRRCQSPGSEDSRGWLWTTRLQPP